MRKIIFIFRAVPLKIWLPIIISFLFPLAVYPILNFSFSSLNEHYFMDMIWSIYILPPIAFAYFFEVKGAIISSFLLQLVHITYEFFVHLNSMTFEVMASMSMQFLLSFGVSYTVGLMSKKLKRNKLELEQAYTNIEKLAYYDPLTGIANRCFFMKSLELEIKRYKKNKKQFALLFLDLDGFKKVNDDFGHDAGDIILTEVVERLINCIREKDLLARFAGDEFILLLPNVSYAETVTIAEKLLKIIQPPFILNNSTARITTSIGIAFYNNESETSSSLIKQADMAMYHAKNLGKNSYHIFYPTMKQIQNEG
ncbi:GGDEF domain-containing protein [Bacillus salipaludis]|uniref:GGDEF domain-containing protein n=1 Tax=Bacillus salipaludis TaxID=2547811 RepID=UPI002E1E2A5A|nr:GGDEF domain-containing protein [Bacillus salipaludis]